MIPSLSLSAWLRIGTALIVAALLVGFLIRGEKLADCRDDKDLLIAKLEISNNSVVTLEAELKRVMAEQVALSTSDAARIAASRQTLEITRAAEKWREAAINRLEQSAVTVSNAPAVEMCEASPAVKAVWE